MRGVDVFILIYAILLAVYAFIFGVLATGWYRRAKRFSLRDAFIALTAVAILLALFKLLPLPLP
jgi:hypothetical protein